MIDPRNTMFEVPIYHYQVKDWNLKKKQLLELYSTLNLIETETVSTDFGSQEKIDYWNEIVNILGEEIESFSNEVGHSLTEFGHWFENSKEGMYHEVHNHGSIGYSSVCFINYDPLQHTPTKFVSPFNHFWTGTQLTYSPNQIKEGSIIFFPSAINHYTLPNKSKCDRLILSFNLIPKEIYETLRSSNKLKCT